MVQLLFFLSGLGILLHAMHQMEYALSRLGEGQLRMALRQLTRSPLSGVLLGTLTTAFLQSSSLVGLMTMAFVGAGVLPLRNAIGLILGANLGTTLTGWLVATLGFKVDLDQFHVLLIGTGAILSLQGAQDSKIRHVGAFAFALGLLLLALVLMKEGVGFVVELVDVERLRALPETVYFLFGIVLTAIVQSSSATMMLTLAAVSEGILELPSAAAVVVGANLGTTSTLLLGALRGSATKRQIAFVHVFFNLVVSGAAMIALQPLLWLVTEVYAINDPLFDLVALHSTFNFLGIVVFLPFVELMARFVEWLVPSPPLPTLRITQVSPQVQAAAFAALEQDVKQLLQSCILLSAWRLNLLQERSELRTQLLPDSIDEAYRELKGWENQLSDYLLELQRLELTPEQSRRLHQLLVCIRDCLYAAKAVKDCAVNVQEFRRSTRSHEFRFLGELMTATAMVLGKALDQLEATGDHVTTIAELLATVRGAHATGNATIYEQVDRGGFERDQASSALNINRELLLAGHSLVNAVEHYLLPGEEARTVSELLNLR